MPFKNGASFPGCCSFIRVSVYPAEGRAASPGGIAMPGPTSIQSTLIIKRALAARPANSRAPCYFKYKNFQGIARRESKGARVAGAAAGTGGGQRGGTEKERL